MGRMVTTETSALYVSGAGQKCVELCSYTRACICGSMSRLRLAVMFGQAKSRQEVQLVEEPSQLLWLCLGWIFLCCFERQSSYL